MHAHESRYRHLLLGTFALQRPTEHMHIDELYAPHSAPHSGSRRTQLTHSMGGHAQQPDSAGERAETPYSITCYTQQNMHETPVFIG